MKKIFLFAIAAVSLTVGCQKIADLNKEIDPLDDGTPVPVVFGTNVATISTKAAVEESFGETDAVTIYGIDNTATDLTDNTAFLVKEHLLSPVATTNTLTDVYYGVNKETYSFYGYYVGGLSVTPEYGTNTITIPVEISGDEDIMIGLTSKSADLASKEGEQTVDLDDLYSAKSARRGVKPTLVFDHKLTRFDFVFTDGSKSATKSVQVERIDVESVAEGSLVITHGETPSGVLTPTEDAEAIPLSLGTLKAEAEDASTWKPCVSFPGEEGVVDPVNAGSIMVMPGDASYPVTLHLSQADATTVVTQDLTLEMTDGTFEAGKKYTVNITLYGLEPVIVDVTVSPWTSGGDFTYDPDENDDPVFTPAQ